MVNLDHILSRAQRLLDATATQTPAAQRFARWATGAMFIVVLTILRCEEILPPIRDSTATRTRSTPRGVTEHARFGRGSDGMLYREGVAARKWAEYRRDRKLGEEEDWAPPEKWDPPW